MVSSTHRTAIASPSRVQWGHSEEVCEGADLMLLVEHLGETFERLVVERRQFFCGGGEGGAMRHIAHG